jgi:hypothetical protein
MHLQMLRSRQRQLRMKVIGAALLLIATSVLADPAQLNSAKVPADLRDLVPLAAKWGISDDGERDALHERATKAEKQALAKALKGRNKRITQWLDQQKDPMSDEAAAFMYMQLGLDEMGLWQD